MFSNVKRRKHIIISCAHLLFVFDRFYVTYFRFKAAPVTGNIASYVGRAYESGRQVLRLNSNRFFYAHDDLITILLK